MASAGGTGGICSGRGCSGLIGSRAPPEAPPEGLTRRHSWGLSRGLTRGLPRGLTQGLTQGLPRGLLHRRTLRRGAFALHSRPARTAKSGACPVFPGRIPDTHASVAFCCRSRGRISRRPPQHGHKRDTFASWFLLSATDKNPPPSLFFSILVYRAAGRCARIFAFFHNFFLAKKAALPHKGRAAFSIFAFAYDGVKTFLSALPFLSPISPPGRYFAMYAAKSSYGAPSAQKASCRSIIISFSISAVGIAVLPPCRSVWPICSKYA